jgi:vacuolar-type H+-ATPase subunit I/STV1
MIQQIKKSVFTATQSLTLGTRVNGLIVEPIVKTYNLRVEKGKVENGIDILDDCLSRSPASDYTHGLKEADGKCDESVRFLTNNTKSFFNHHLPEKRDAGMMLYKIIKQHITDISKLGYVNEMAKITALGTELQEDKYKTAAQTLNLTAEIQYMIDSKNAFEKLYVEKNVSERDRTNMVGTKYATKKLLESLEEIIEKLNANLLLNPSPELKELATSLNSVIDSVTKASR